MSAVLALLVPFLSIISHRAGPDVLPASRFLLGLVIFTHLMIYALGMYLGHAPPIEIISMPLIDMLAQVLFFSVLLGIAGFKARTLQTLIAAFGVDIIFNSVLLPVAWAMPEGGGVALPPLLSFFALAVLLWSIAVKGHIVHRAIGVPYFVAVLIALGFVVALYVAGQKLFGA